MSDYIRPEMTNLVCPAHGDVGCERCRYCDEVEVDHLRAALAEKEKEVEQAKANIRANDMLGFAARAEAAEKEARKLRERVNELESAWPNEIQARELAAAQAQEIKLLQSGEHPDYPWARRFDMYDQEIKDLREERVNKSKYIHTVAKMKRLMAQVADKQKIIADQERRISELEIHNGNK